MAIFSRERLNQLQHSPIEEKTHTVLVVDDEGANLRLMESILGETYTVLTATDGESALDLIRKIDPANGIQLMITDQRMPRMSGLEFLHEANRLLPLAKSIVVTAYTDVDVIIDSVNNAHIYKFILKPFDNHDFLLTVKRAIEAYDLEDKTRRLNLELSTLNETLERRIEERTMALNQANEKLRREIEDRLKVHREKEELIEKLQSALENVKELKGLLPICANCKKIRDDGGYWNQLEAYFHKFSDISFTHALCPDCMEHLYGQYDWYQKNETEIEARSHQPPGSEDDKPK